MHEFWRRLRNTEDRGVTLIEMLVVMAIFSVVMGAAYAVLATVQQQTAYTLSRGDDVDQARLALAEIDRQVRSGNVLYDPALEPLPLSMRVYTQANGQQRCVQWQIHNGSLRSRSWSTAWQTDGQVSAWRAVAHNIINDAASKPFVLQGGTTAYGARLVDVKLLVKSSTPKAKPIEMRSSLSGRNTLYGYDPGVCSPMPAP